jgi:hypothetical protein
MANTLFAEKNRASWLGIRAGVYGEQITLSGQVVGVGTAIIYTVPVGKTLLLFGDWTIGQAGSVAGTDIYMAIYNAVPAIIYYLYRIANPGTTFGYSKSVSRFVPLELTAGFSVRIGVVVNGTVSGGIEGLVIDPLENT